MASTLRDMSLTCARVSCGVAAAASVQFNAELAQVVIIDLSDRTIGIPLCHDHTRTRTPPIGWTLIDSRTGVRQGVMLDTPTTDGLPPSSTDGPGDRPPMRRPLDRGFAWERTGDRRSEDGSLPKDSAIPPAPIEHHLTERAALDSEVAATDAAVSDAAVSDNGAADTAAAEHAPDPEPTPSAESAPADGLPTSPLLARAFRNAHSDHVD